MPRRILIITAGATPQIVTETLYALLSREEPWRPDQLYLATTASGKALFEQGGGRLNLPPLLGEGGKLRQMYAELGLGAEPLPEIHWVLALDPDGTPCDDIRSPEEVEAFANALFSEIRKLADDAANEIHLSIAGGRKTMSFIAGQVMSLCARHQDRMSHCLVQPQELEARPDFWWPPAEGPGSDAQIDLHEVDFLKISAHLKLFNAFPQGASWSDGVGRANTALAVDRISLDFNNATLTVAGKTVQFFRGRQFAALALPSIATRLNMPLRGPTRNAGPTMNGDVNLFWRNWARCVVLSGLERCYEGNADWAADNPNRMNAEIENQFNQATEYQRGDILWRQTWNDMWSRPRSNGSELIKENFTEHLRRRLYPPVQRGAPIYYVDFPPDNIEIVLPAELTLDFFLN